MSKVVGIWSGKSCGSRHVNHTAGYGIFEPNLRDCSRSRALSLSRPASLSLSLSLPLPISLSPSLPLALTLAKTKVVGIERGKSCGRTPHARSRCDIDT